jgi:hypothetical protein
LYWLLSLYSPSASDSVDWTGGDYRLLVRSGRVESASASGALKKQARMVSEGGVLSAGVEPVGAAVDVAPDGFAHPVYRSGLALALQFPSLRISVEKEKAVEEPMTVEEAIEPVVDEERPEPVVLEVVEEPVTPAEDPQRELVEIPVEEPPQEPVPEPTEPELPEQEQQPKTQTEEQDYEI